MRLSARLHSLSGRASMLKESAEVFSMLPIDPDHPV